MAISIKETFKVAAPINKVWDFMLSPENVVACMPGASLTEIVDAQRFLGAVKIKIGAVTAQYQGSITYQKVDKGSYTVELLAEGSERNGGGVSGTITTQLIELADGSGTEIHASSVLDLSGRIAQLGRGMIEGVSAQVIKKYVGNIRALLEVPDQPAASSAPGTAPTQPTPPVQHQKEDSINVVAVVFKVLWDGLRNLFRRKVGS